MVKVRSGTRRQHVATTENKCLEAVCPLFWGGWGPFTNFPTRDGGYHPAMTAFTHNTELKISIAAGGLGAAMLLASLPVVIWLLLLGRWLVKK